MRPPCLPLEELQFVFSGRNPFPKLQRRTVTSDEEERDRYWPAGPLVFYYLGRPIGSHIKGWKEACRRLGVPGLLFHDLRRSAVRNLERAGFPRKLAMSISGHKREAVYLRYDIVSPEDLKIARSQNGAVAAAVLAHRMAAAGMG